MSNRNKQTRAELLREIEALQQQILELEQRHPPSETRPQGNLEGALNEGEQRYRTLAQAAFDIPYSHHERWDGSGYPCGLKATHIPLAVRVFAVVDAFDALTSDRSYRHAWKREDVLAHIHGQAGIQFDPDVVEVFLRTIS